ncbi:MAG TPA: hypothetical protein PKE12_04290 [Kiritimatiellia bacterium]|nr:hypothetical protein [Kiritimatiellia bacterium]
MKKHIMLAAGLAGLLSVAVGCGRSGAPESPTAVVAELPAALAAVFRAVPAPESITPIPALRTAVRPGDAVVIEAKVMGTETPFVDGRALVVVGDEGTLESCDLRPGDSCETPWDVCCEDPATIRAGTATIQIVDSDGRVLKAGLRGVNGLTELSRVRVAGTVAPESTGDALIVNAEAIEVL